ncbi:MAG: hypothetical protein ACKOW9_01060 [Candidatus Paceibacterota bacterium]
MKNSMTHENIPNYPTPENFAQNESEAEKAQNEFIDKNKKENHESLFEEVEHEIAATEEIVELIKQKAKEIGLSFEGVLADKQGELLEKLEKTNQNFLKKMSEFFSRQSKEAVGNFRDILIAEKAGRLRKRLYDSKIIQGYSWGNKNISERKFRGELERIFHSAESLVSIIEKDSWGSSKYGDKANGRVNSLMKDLIDKAAKYGYEDTLFRLFEVYENSQKINEHKDQTFNHAAYRIQEYIGQQHQPGIDPEKIMRVYRGDTILIFEHISRYRSSDTERAELIGKHLDILLEKYPNGKQLTRTANYLALESLSLFPDRYAFDPKFSRTIYEIAKQTGGIDGLRGNTHFFHKYLSETTNEDISAYVQNFDMSSLSRRETQTLVANLPLSEEHFEKIFKQIGSFSEEPTPYTKEALLKLLEEKSNDWSGALQIPLAHAEYFGLSPEKRLEYFKKAAESTDGYYGFEMLVNMMRNRDQVLAGLDESSYQPIFATLMQRTLARSPQKLRLLHAFAQEYSFPQNLMEEANAAFAKNENRDSELFKKIFKIGQEEERPMTKDEEWAKNNPDVYSKLELAFYANAYENEIRHVFYEVIEGRRQVHHMDELVKAYVDKSSSGIGPEEFIDLFVTGKKLPMSYARLFIPRISDSSKFFSQIAEKERLEEITKEQYSECLFLVTETGGPLFADSAFETCSKAGIFPEDKQAFMARFADNLFKNLQGYNDYQKFFEDVLKKKIEAKYLTQEEKVFITRRIFDGGLERSNMHKVFLKISISSNPYAFPIAFPTEEERKKYAQKLFETKNQSAMGEILRDGLGTIEGLRKLHPFLQYLDEATLRSVVSRAIEDTSLTLDAHLFGLIDQLNPEDRQLFLQKITSTPEYFGKNIDRQELRTFCSQTVKTVLYNKKLTEEILSKDDIDALFTNILRGEGMTPHILDEIKLGPEFFATHPKVFSEYIDALVQKGNSKGAQGALVYLRDNRLLSGDQVKKLSEKTLEDERITGALYQMYLDSTPDTPKFYLDQEMLNEHMKEFIKSSGSYSTDGMIDFLTKQRTLQWKEEIATLSAEQERVTIEKILQKDNLSHDDLLALRSFDSVLFSEIFARLVEEEKAKPRLLLLTLEGDASIGKEHINKIIDYSFKSSYGVRGVFEKLLEIAHEDKNVVEKLKAHVNKIESIENRVHYKSLFLQKDLLTPVELKEFYGEIRSQKNVRSQVLLSAELLGSLVSSDNPESIKAFFPEESENAQEKIERISSFVQKYPLQKKGRTIAVMLFAKEYLPERSAEEIVDKVGDKLAKYERVLNRYQYEGIPEGLGASIGVEYEITHSTAEAYEELTSRELKNDIVRLSEAAHIGAGRDAVHEVATRPATNPYLMLLELQILHDIEYVDFNFDRSPKYQKGSRGYHLTIGGENGLSVNANTHFLQNAILAASWGGINAGETGKRVSGGRGVTLRGRSANDSNNVTMFSRPTSSVELRSLSVDKFEPFQRSVITAYHGAIAIQALEKNISLSSDQIVSYFGASRDEFIQNLKDARVLAEGETDSKTQDIMYTWATLVKETRDALEYHNNQFVSGETNGYLDADEDWIDAGAFGGEYNKQRFESIVASIDPTLSVEEYARSTNISYNKMFLSFDVALSDSLTKINNLYLKPAVKNEGSSGRGGAGDQANALAMLEVTKLSNDRHERLDEPAYLNGTIFDTLGERREGYYNVQGASERMLTHAMQAALLKFNRRMEELLQST